MKSKLINTIWTLSFNSSIYFSQILKQISCPLQKTAYLGYNFNKNISSSFNSKLYFRFSHQNKEPLTQQQIPQQNLEVTLTEQKIQQEQVQVFHTKGTLSILDKVPGTKNPQSGQLYVLMFTCGQCNSKQIKSFTKNAYHKGVVLARCVGCDQVHLVADNLGWFNNQPTNVQTLHKDKVKKVHDPAAINAFLKKAFEEQNQLLTNVKQKINKS